jgi:predicted MFS family arabinose efflux permease
MDTAIEGGPHATSTSSSSDRISGSGDVSLLLTYTSVAARVRRVASSVGCTGKTRPARPARRRVASSEYGMWTSQYRWRVARFVVDIAPLRSYRHFRRLWAGQMVSGLGTQLTLVAVSFQAYGLTHSTLVVGLIGVAQLVPLLAGALWGGALADAVDRRTVLVVSQVASAGAVLGLVVNASYAHPSVWPLFVCTAAGAGIQGVDWPARRSAIPLLVSGADVTAAIALQTTIQQLALVAGPALAGVLISTIGLSAVYGIDVASFGVAFVAALLLPALAPTGGGTPMGLRSMAEGFRHLRGQKLLSATYWIDLNAMIFGMPRAVFPALGTGLFGGGAGVVGLLYAAPGAGALIGSLVTGWCSRVHHQGRAIASCVVIWGVCITLFGVIPVLWIGLVLLALAGAADVVSAVFRQAVQERTVPDHLQGRLSGTFFAVVAGGPRLGDAETGAAAAIGGPQFAVWSGGMACVVGVGVLLWRIPDLWQDRGGGAALSAQGRFEAVAESASKLGEGEPL